MQALKIIFGIFFALIALFAGGCAIYVVADIIQYGFRAFAREALFASIVACAIATFFARLILSK